MAPTIDQIKLNDVLSYWDDPDARVPKLSYIRVVKIGPTKLKARYEGGGEAWKYPQAFHAIVPENTVAAMITDGSLKV